MPRLLLVVLVAAVLYAVVTYAVPLPPPFGWIFLLVLLLWVVFEALRLAGYSWRDAP